MFTSVNIEIDEVVDGLDATGKRAHRLGPAFVEIKAAMKLDQREHREQEMGPDGKWSPRKASTLKSEKLHHKGRVVPRKILGKLPTAVTYKAIGSGAFGESKIRWSESQQGGGRVGKGAMIPARPFLWVSDKLARTSEEIIERHIIGKAGG